MKTVEIESWPGPPGLIPVTSGKADDANLYNRAYLDSLHVEMRIMDAQLPELTTQIFGRTFASPIMMPAFSHLNKVGLDGRTPMEEYALAALELNYLNWVGMESNEDFASIMSIGAPTVRIIKPFADHGIILDQIAQAEELGAVAVGIDIDHVPGTDGNYDVVDTIPLGPVTCEDLSHYTASTSLPFVAKGVLSVQDAQKVVASGCRSIVVSHHHGRLPFGVSPAQVLPAIAQELSDKNIEIFADCGLDSGYDVYKVLALGAHAASVGRTILKPLLRGGTPAVVDRLQKIRAQLSELMLYTGVQDTASFDASVIHTC